MRSQNTKYRKKILTEEVGNIKGFIAALEDIKVDVGSWHGRHVRVLSHEVHMS